MSSNESRTLRWWLLTVMIVLAANIHLFGQVKFKVALMPDNVTYRVSMLPEVTWATPQNITSTAQVVLKVPTGGFEVENLTNLVPNVFWSNNARYDHPVEAPGFDYLTFGLTSLGTSNLSYVEGVEVDLFEFENAGLCTGPVEIMANDDPFFPPNDINANVNNQITTLGTGLGSNGFTGSHESGSANCLPDVGCQVAFELNTLPDGSYQVSVIPEESWAAPANTTDTLRVCLQAATGSFNMDGLESLIPGVSFSLANSFFTPNQNPAFDYFVVRLATNGTGAISYNANTKTPLFLFSNSGECNGDSLRLADAQTDPFAQANFSARNRIRTTGAGATLEACVAGAAQVMKVNIDGVSSSSPTDCDHPNGTVNINASGISQIEYSINGGVDWQAANLFPDLVGGNYQVRVRKADGSCETSYANNPVVLGTASSPIINNVTAVQPTGCGSNSGSIFVQATGSPGMQYTINGGSAWSATNIFNNLAPGSYQPGARNSDGTCAVFDTPITLNSGGATPAITAVNFTKPTDCTGEDGSISIVADGDDLEYSVNNGLTWQASGDFGWLGEGNYNILVKNPTDGCVAVYADNPVSLFKDDCPGCTVEYKLELLPDGKYLVSLISHVDWNFPQNITSTAQVTIVVPAGQNGQGGFFVNNLTNLQPGVTFSDNVRVNHPTENPGFDYIAFGLETLGTIGIPYVDGEEVPLFTFENGGVCTGPGIYLMDDNTDPFVPPNSVSANVGQQLTTVGGGQDAFVCIVDPGFALCTPEMANDLQAVDDTFDLFANTVFNGGLLGNDLNPNGGTLTMSQIPVSGTSFGLLVLNQNGTFTYTPNPGFTGTDQFSYLVCDDGTPAACDTGLVTLHINPALLAVNDFYSISSSNLLTGNVLLNDLNLAGNQWAVNLTPLVPPAFGSVSLTANGAFTYTPSPGFEGEDSFQYIVCQSTAVPLCDTATVFIQILPEVNAENDSFDVPIGSVFTATVVDNDTWPTGADYEVTILPSSGPLNGTLLMQPGGTFTYTPNPGFSGQDQFSYSICETGSASNCDVATVSLTVLAGLTAVDDAFVVMPDITFSSNVLGNDLIPVGVVAEAALLPNTGPSHGLLTFGADGDFNYTPDPGFEGMDTYEYIVVDMAAPQSRDTATVMMEVFKDLTAVNDVVVLPQGSQATGNILENDLTGGTPATVSIIPNSGPGNGTLTLNPNGDFTYVPDPGFSGDDTFLYEVCLVDMPSVCDTAMVEITVVGSIAELPTPIINCPAAYCSEGTLDLSISQIYSGNSVSYNWFNGDGALVGLEAILSLSANSPLAVPPFRVRAIVDGNVSPLSAQCSAEKVDSPVAIASVDGPFCAGDDVQLFADFQPENHYEWRKTGQPQILSTQANPFIFNILQSSEYLVTVFNDACPNVATATVSVQVNASPVITDIAGGGTFCHGEAVTLSAINGTPGSGNLTYTWTGPDNFFFTSPAASDDDFSITLNTLVPENEGAYTLTLASENGCASPAKSVIVDYVPIPETPELSVSENQLCEGETLELNSTLHTGNTTFYNWYFDDGSGPSAIGATTYPTYFLPSVNASESGVYHVDVIVDGCASEPSNLENVSIIPTSFQAANPTALAAPGCEGINVPLSTPIIAGATYQWYGPNGFSSTVPNPVITDAELADGGEYMAIVNIPACNTEVVSATEVFLSPMPEEPFLTSNSPVCEGSDLMLSVTNPDASGEVTYRFYYEPTNTMVGASNDGTFSISGVSPNEAGLYFSMAEQGGCLADPANMSGVSVDSQPANAAVAGTDETICGLTTEAQLEAIPSSLGAGLWTSPTGATPVNPDQPNTLATGLAEGQNIFVWSLSNGSCLNFSSDTLVLTVADVPAEAAIAGVDETICNANSTILSASSPVEANGAWSQPSWQALAGVSIADPLATTPEVTGLQTGQEYVFTWGLSFGECQNFSTDELVVTVNQGPEETAYIAENQRFTCDENMVVLNANPVFQASGQWTTLSGAALTTPNSASTSAINLSPGPNQFVWSLTSDECPVFSSDTITVFNEELELLADSYMVAVGDSVANFSPAENDFLANVEGWDLTIVSLPQKGELRSLPNGNFTYSPYPSAFGEDRMVYRICSENCPDICDMVEVRFVIDAVPTESKDCFAPNTISPNGDEVNDTFVVPCVASYPGSQCTIFNRWGDSVYESKNYQNDWDGTYENQPLPVGTYFYVINLNDGEDSMLCGYVVVFRE